MESVMTVLVAVCLVIGIFFALAGVVGVLKYKDFFSRTQAATCITTMGVVGAILAGIFYSISKGFAPIWYVKLIITALLIFLSGAVSGHSLAKGNYKRGHRPEHGGFALNDYEEDGLNDD